MSDNESILSSKIIDFRSQINAQIGACRWGLTVSRSLTDIQQAGGAISVLTAMLVRQLKWDKKYNHGMNELCILHKQELQKMSTRRRDSMQAFMYKAFLIKKLSLIVDCATRKGFTYNEEVTEDIEVRAKRGIRKEMGEKERAELKTLSSNSDILSQEEGIVEGSENEAIPPVDPELEKEEEENGAAEPEAVD